MPIPAYPATLPPLLRATKSRSQAASFTVAEPRRGYGYAQATGTDVPVFWDGELRFDQYQSIAFQLWLKTVVLGGLLEFSMPIRTEFGLIEHVCRFLPDGLADATEQAGIYTYKVKIMARAQVVPDGYIEAADLIIGLPNWPQWLDPLDRAINVEMPEA
ncbi:hypothetical protein [Pseudorhodoferax sp. Leaf265]|uniref:hypothetical protein n=1 Tax=Pseudorhodoferax sp. Leaf265 TaxID=1736315 RepID=UPI0006FBE54D|nr:hypothetical protein [Pseudorhodoferax sp. Leaf265]KQP02450.1 hypothetical protein ASF45_20565 [Pseudorhodoferax sp. Leaf265]